MKAIVCNDFGPIKNIKYMDVENPEIDDESILKVFFVMSYFAEV